MKKYEVQDLQGANFMDYTYEEPETGNELRSHFWLLDDVRTEKYKDFTLDFIQEMWDVEFKEVKN